MALFSTCAKKRVQEKCLVALVFAVVLLVLAVPRALMPVAQQNLGSKAHLTQILVWWPPFGKAAQLPDCAASYGVHGCTLTLDRNEYENANAVLMHHRDLVSKPGELPLTPRPDGQKWIWMNFESPSNTPWLEGMDEVFNLTMSYHFGSDIFLPYGYLRRHHGNHSTQVHRSGNNRQRKGIQHNKNNAKTGIHSPVNNHGNDDSSPIDHHGSHIKTPLQSNKNFIHPAQWHGVYKQRALVAWVISNWNEDQERVQFYWRLRRYIRVDIYGRKAQRRVKNSILETISGYKFYLAFENSLHSDYITEKLWRNALQAGAVPVVLGPPRENYERFLPADAFIHVDDFKSPRALAAYLLYLDRNPNQYRRYLSWRRDYTVHVTSFWAEHYCAACQAVQASQNIRKTVKNLAYWFQS